MKITHITIQTANFENEIKFYQKYCQMTIQNDMRPVGKNIVFLAQDEGDTRLEIIEKKEADYTENENFSVGIFSENFAELHQRLISDGFQPTPVLSPMPQVSFFFVKDPAGVTVQFM